MILYLDTSALVKLYVCERGSAGVRARVASAEVVATSVVAYAESRATFARLLRERPASRARHNARVKQLDRDWERYARVELTPVVVHRAGEAAEQYGLRGFDAIHLASALWLQSVHPHDLLFAAFDGPLTTAARTAGLQIPVERTRRRRTATSP